MDSGFSLIWLFCTNKLATNADNNANVIPNSTSGAPPLLAGFTQQADPPVKGVSIWSSCAYDNVLNRIYVGTGNSSAGDENPLPDAYYWRGRRSHNNDHSSLSPLREYALVRNGCAPNGKQKYLCRACQRQSRDHPTPHAYPEDRREEILRAFEERSSLRGLERTFGVSRHTVIAWIKKSSQTASFERNADRA